MEDFMQSLVYLYMNAGIIGVGFVVGAILLIWWLTKGKAQKLALHKELDKKYDLRAELEHEDRERQIAETAMLKEVLKNNTAVINNNTHVLTKNDALRKREVDILSELDNKIDALVQSQAICLDRNRRKE